MIKVHQKTIPGHIDYNVGSSSLKDLRLLPEIESAIHMSTFNNLNRYLLVPNCKSSREVITCADTC